MLAGYPDGRVDEGPGAGHASLVGLPSPATAAGAPTQRDKGSGRGRHRASARGTGDTPRETSQAAEGRKTPDA